MITVRQYCIFMKGPCHFKCVFSLLLLFTTFFVYMCREEQSSADDETRILARSTKIVRCAHVQPIYFIKVSTAIIKNESYLMHNINIRITI